MDKIRCPNCSKLNDMHKFCIYCGNELPISKYQIELIKSNPDSTCLNCGRPVEKGQNRCECGYELADIKCHECGSKNTYANRFCISCGEKLWTSGVYDYKYNERLFEHHFLNETLPFSFRNTSLYQRPKKGIGKNPIADLGYGNGMTLKEVELENKKVERNLCEIKSRWKIISPHYCISCLSTIEKTDELQCPRCKSSLGDEKRIEKLLTKNNYIYHRFDIESLKWTSKRRESYLHSLAPARGESQFEYRERLKWEFAENNNLKKSLKNMQKWIIDTKNAEKNRIRTSPQISNKPPEGEWEMYGMTQDMWERQMFEEMERRNEEYVEHWKEFWEDT